MIVLYVFLALVLALVLLSLVRVETRVRWDDQGLRVHVRVGPVGIQVYPIRRRGKAPLCGILLPARSRAAGRSTGNRRAGSYPAGQICVARNIPGCRRIPRIWFLVLDALGPAWGTLRATDGAAF